MVYLTAKQRCSNTKGKAYPVYGGRGIGFRFTSFLQFYNEVGPRPSSAHQIDRIDNSGHYEPGNIRWATRQEQMRNFRRNRHIVYDGKRMTVAEAAERSGIKYRTLISRVMRGEPESIWFRPSKERWATKGVH